MNNFWRYLNALLFVVGLVFSGTIMCLLIVFLPIWLWGAWGAAVPLALAWAGIVYFVAEDF